MKKAIAILYQGHQQETEELALQLAPQLHAQGHDVRVIEMRGEEKEQVECQLEDRDVGLVLGGDGTILQATRLCAQANILIVGVNFGRVGSLTELEPEEVVKKVPLYLEPDESVWIDKRSMLHAELQQAGKPEAFLVLNEIVITRSIWSRVVEIHIWIDADFYKKTSVDGMLLCTATGSTASHMAVGGPLLHPQVESWVLTPIAPRLAFDRSLILPPEATVKLQIFPHAQQVVFSADGQMNREMTNGATVTVRKSRYQAHFLRRGSLLSRQNGGHTFTHCVTLIR